MWKLINRTATTMLKVATMESKIVVAFQIVSVAAWDAMYVNAMPMPKYRNAMNKGEVFIL